jgi:hypothetical protein
MKPLILALTAAFLAVTPALRAEDSPKADPKPAPTAKAEGEGAKDPALEAQRKRFGEVRKQASEDPAVKAALDAAKAALNDANTKLHAKMLEIDPSLAPMIDKEKAKMSGRREGGDQGGRREKAAPKKDGESKPGETH